MDKVYTSASKIVFILIAVTVCAALFVGKIDPKDFLVLASMSFTYYFTRDKGDKPVTATGNEIG